MLIFAVMQTSTKKRIKYGKWFSVRYSVKRIGTSGNSNGVVWGRLLCDQLLRRPFVLVFSIADLDLLGRNGEVDLHRL